MRSTALEVIIFNNKEGCKVHKWKINEHEIERNPDYFALKTFLIKGRLAGIKYGRSQKTLM